MKVFYIKTDGLVLDDIIPLLNLLDEKKQQSILLYKNDSDKINSILGYTLLYLLLKDELGTWIKPIIKFDGKPSLIYPKGYHFNISHSGNFVCCVLSKCEIGLDVELVKDYKDKLSRYVSNDDEYEMIINSENKDKSFTSLWTKKESIIKLKGNSITNHLKEVITDDVVFETIDFNDYMMSICRYKK